MLCTGGLPDAACTQVWTVRYSAELNWSRAHRSRSGSHLTSSIFNPRVRSLARGNIIVLTSLAIATLISKFPHLRATPWLVIPSFGCLVGMADTVRCMQKRWSLYHGGVLLCVYMDLMAITLVLFFLLYPYLVWLGETH